MHVWNARISILSVFVLLISYTTAQTNDVINEILEQVSSQISDDEEFDFTTAYEDLLYYYQNPINLNNATKEQLEQLLFLDDIQIENLLFYQYQYGEIYTIHELSLIENFDEQTINTLKKFVCVGKTEEKQKYTFKDIFKYGKHDFFIRNDVGFEKKQGFKRTKDDINTSPEKYYLGDPFYASLKYRSRYKNNIQFGLSAEKDIGEPFVGKYNKGYDSYNGYLQINDLWKFKNIVVGDYRAVFGQGLVIRSEFSMPEASVLHISPRNSGLRKSSSTDEYYFLRGIGATLDFNNFQFTAFYSYRKMDADTTGGVFSSITTNGLHRKISELNKKRTLPVQIVGGNVSYNARKFHIGITSSTVIYGISQEQNSELYTQFLPNGKVQSVLGIDYRFRLHKFNFLGETAVSTNRGIATINSVFFTPTSRIGIVFSHRYYSPRYEHLYANAFGSNTNNENGFYVGLEILPLKSWKISASANAYRCPWAKYQTNGATTFYRLLGKIEYTPTSKFTLRAQIHFRQDDSNNNELTTTKQLVTTSNLKHTYTAYYQILGIKFKTYIAANHAKVAKNATTHGFLILQNIDYTIPKIQLHLNGGYAYFDAEDYNNRFSVYENDIPNVFSIPMLYGKGCRYYMNIGYNMLKNFGIWIKFAQTYYSDNRTCIGSGWDTINGNHKSDFRVQLRFSF